MRQKNGTGLVWLRRDLRWQDQAAWHAAERECENIVVVFVFDQSILAGLSPSDKRVSFIIKSLNKVDEYLSAMGSRLVCVFGNPVLEIPRLVVAFQASHVFAAEDFEPDARTRDFAVKKELEQINCRFEWVLDQSILHPSVVRPLNGAHFKLFTAYWRAWQKQISAHDYAEKIVHGQGLVPSALIQAKAGNLLCPPMRVPGFEISDFGFEAGADAAQQRLKQFGLRLGEYSQNRTRVDSHGSSLLSVDLRFGTISVRECVRMAMSRPCDSAKVWLSELVWREFFQSLLLARPDTVNASFRIEYEAIRWENNSNFFESWTQGETGFPIVDAAMRCLSKTGLIHNRLRMLVASFLVKDLLVDWRKGERWFASTLLDFELASNVGNWQWCASVGCDAVPYFRIFNPVLQSEKIDPDGLFIRQWCPELANVPKTQLHQPQACAIVRHELQKQRFLSVIQRARQK